MHIACIAGWIQSSILMRIPLVVDIDMHMAATEAAAVMSITAKSSHFVDIDMGMSCD